MTCAKLLRRSKPCFWLADLDFFPFLRGARNHLRRRKQFPCQRRKPASEMPVLARTENLSVGVCWKLAAAFPRFVQFATHARGQFAIAPSPVATTKHPGLAAPPVRKLLN